MPNRINTRYFQALLAERDISQRQLAKKLQLDPSAVSNTLLGKREMKLQEAVDIASLLGVNVADVLSNAGVRHAPDGERMVPVVGKLGEAFEVMMNWKSRSEHVIGPAVLPEDAVASNDMTTVHAVNKELRARGRDERLKRGRGYFYVYGGGAENWRESGIYAMSLTPWTTEQVIAAINHLKEAA